MVPGAAVRTTRRILAGEARALLVCRPRDQDAWVVLEREIDFGDPAVELVDTTGKELIAIDRKLEKLWMMPKGRGARRSAPDAPWETVSVAELEAGRDEAPPADAPKPTRGWDFTSVWQTMLCLLFALGIVLVGLRGMAAPPGGRSVEDLVADVLAPTAILLALVVAGRIGVSRARQWARWLLIVVYTVIAGGAIAGAVQERDVPMALHRFFLIWQFSFAGLYLIGIIDLLRSPRFRRAA